jgi:hypothetical protein
MQMPNLNLINIGGRFIAAFPLWVIEHHSAEAVGYLEARHPSGSKATPLFTEEANALAKLENERVPEQSRAQYHVSSINDPAALLEVLNALEAKGFTYVILDPYLNKATPFTIAEVRQAALEGRGKKTPPTDPEQA